MENQKKSREKDEVDSTDLLAILRQKQKLYLTTNDPKEVIILEYKLLETQKIGQLDKSVDSRSTLTTVIDIPQVYTAYEITEPTRTLSKNTSIYNYVRNGYIRDYLIKYPEDKLSCLCNTLSKYPYSGKTKFDVCTSLNSHSIWKDLADVFEIKRSQWERFEQGREAFDLWDVLEDRNKLYELESALRDIGQSYLIKKLYLSYDDDLGGSSENVSKSDKVKKIVEEYLELEEHKHNIDKLIEFIWNKDILNKDLDNSFEEKREKVCELVKITVRILRP
ncbi:MAG: hypothetical protein QNJ46_03040 [Leptolyngbyaceae cyanobacterium MO_188.B28]|nr:hypothetical protein [Leptolyngbyaceae cyanobacterium MO_188.B28]